jgi:hypothetical protein
MEVLRREIEAHLLELVDGARGEAVTAGLGSRELLAVDDEDVVAIASQPVGGGAATGSAADYENAW